jgi:hypothetical protein
LTTGGLHAQTAEPAEENPAHALQEVAQEYHRHHAAAFLGGATRLWGQDHQESGMTVGVEYEYRFHRNWGVEGVLEGVFLHEHHRDLAFAAPLTWHPVGGLKLTAGPGFEDDGKHVLFMFRVSAGYAFELEGITIGPEVAMDFADGSKTIVYGFSIGCGF